MTERPATRCPICGEPVPPHDRNDAYPFCSKRCRLIDLGNWLDGRYAIPGPPSRDPRDPDDG
ncbi:MAG: DNA gyrase inhibitor YacG [Deltaproteobacteria bacterium]|nr:MAG: DNA gyrase inhibitor YacG [Deltaproteobacteria bacterium]